MTSVLSYFYLISILSPCDLHIITSPFPSYNHLYHISMLSLCDLHFIISLFPSYHHHLDLISILSLCDLHLTSMSDLHLILIFMSSPLSHLHLISTWSPSYHICVWSPSEMTWGGAGVGGGGWGGGGQVPPAAGAHSAGRWAQRPCPSAARPSRTWTCHQSKRSAKCTRLNHTFTWGGVGVRLNNNNNCGHFYSTVPHHWQG